MSKVPSIARSLRPSAWENAAYVCCSAGRGVSSPSGFGKTAREKSDEDSSPKLFPRGRRAEAGALWDRRSRGTVARPGVHRLWRDAQYGDLDARAGRAADRRQATSESRLPLVEGPAPPALG